MGVVKRLRFFAPKSVADLYSAPEQVMSDAADEIERLRKRVAMLEDALKKEWTISEAFALLADGMEEEGNNGHC